MQKQVSKLKEHLATSPIPTQKVLPDASLVVPTEVPDSPWQPCYPWENNFCWLDASLQLLYMALGHNFSEFSSLIHTIEPGHPLQTLHSMFEQHPNFKPNQPNCTQILKKQHNNLHQQLIEHQQTGDPASFGPLMVCRDTLW